MIYQTRSLTSEEQIRFDQLLRDRFLTGEGCSLPLFLLLLPLGLMMASGASSMVVAKLFEVLGASGRTERNAMVATVAIVAPSTLCFALFAYLEFRRRAREIRKDREQGLVDTFLVRPREAVEVDGAFYLDIGDHRLMYIVGQAVDSTSTAGMFPTTSFELVRLANSKIPIALYLQGEPLKPTLSFAARSFTLSRKGSGGPLLAWQELEGPLPRKRQDLKMLKRIVPS